ncbi:LPXTG cell wall anchor domain-containing protein [Streptomyces cylindrosporus]|uniref:LPXTG cell wall anchor domain-containing protein n=1 Tax=Streptomyces cylindrosporus TaxID=2927583 RepID=A0ABS9YGZ2_9ACTN|nr:LPXTG cell wall anchor domain-containing protein [Streptomyces cylindrosporus]MCI3276499.1 LPXTG cell wall anchor domain-containing protein [Streptomyces cylindrosporus]
MRLFTPTSLCLAAAAALLPVPPPASASTTPTRPAPTCAAPDARGFPLTTRIHGAPAGYEAGGGYGTWYLDLTNTTDRTCAAVHPVVVLIDEKRALRPSQPRLEFYDGPRTHPVHFETTDEAELVGAFDDGFPGFTVGPGKTLTVKVRLALTSDAVPNEVTANAAVVQRHDDDGDWIGQSNDYRFRISDDPLPDPSPTGTAPPARDEPLPFADELARTGLDTPAGLLTATALALTGGALLLVRRRR